jgi:hypothetical protein
VERGDSDDGYVDLEKQNFRTAQYENLFLELKTISNDTKEVVEIKGTDIKYDRRETLTLNETYYYSMPTRRMYCCTEIYQWSENSTTSLIES